ncbi:MAG: BlaI/MecI/CopY family transcriptional regulator [Pseudomonadales bacterium]|nr:BlaI/MecI/CopY family transcriptional regulator [Pseudomonadales bacterium]
MTTDVNISDAERIVIETLWRNGALTADQVAKELSPQNDWSFATVKTLLGRLLKKKAISATTEGRRFIYQATLSREEYIGSESKQLIDKLFDGRIAPLVSHFSQTKGLSKQDIDELRALLKRLS